MKKMILIVVAMLAIAGCSTDGYTDNSMRTLRYEKGASQGGKFKECLEPGKKIVSNDKFYPYPTTQREAVWDSDNFEKGSNSADYPDLEVVNKEGVKIYFKMKISFFLNTSCDPIEVDGHKYPGGVLQAYHELIGKTRKAYFRSDGTYGPGWIWAMTNYIGSSATDYLTRNARAHTTDDLYQNVSLQTDLQSGLAKDLPELVNAGMETDLEFYKDFTVKIYKITPEDAYLNLYRDRQAAKVKAETAEANKAARLAQAEADAEVAKKEAEVRKYEIEGYGGARWYMCKYLADKNINCFQPNGGVLVGSK